jgi:hypothetical protein
MARVQQVYYSELILKSLYNKTMNADTGICEMFCCAYCSSERRAVELD